MKPAIRVLAPGLLTTIQDLGRNGFQHLGIPVSGALDSVSLRAANALVGNPPGTATLEIAVLGPTLEILADEVRMAFVGARAAIEILPNVAANAGTLIGSNESLVLRRGDILRIGALTGATTLYVAVEGGFDIAPMLGSVSTFIRGGIGGINGRALAAGDLVPLVRNTATEREEFRLDGFDLAAPERFRVVTGPQADYFSNHSIEKFFASEYRLVGADRMGMRLDGPALQHVRGFNITSDAIAPGSIQVPGNGKPIVLLADRQTTGGYPKIATVISADLPALGRLSVGAKLHFEGVSVEAAVAARRKMLAEIENISEKIVPLVPGGAGVTPRLLDNNLISGFVDGQTGGQFDDYGFAV
jgi:biotin-dependent carboxylase-like uncharacterized protein